MARGMGLFLRGGGAYREGGVEDVVQVYGEEVEKSFTAGHGHGIAGVVYICPRICPLGKAAVGQRVKHTLQEKNKQPLMDGVLHLESS